MGDLRVWLPHPNGVLTEDAPPPSPSPSQSPSASALLSNPHPSSISVEYWQRAEKTVHEIICRIQPTVVSEQRRKAVVDYVQRLIRGFLGSEVFPFGSVPLKTYLPDGDIDLTALSYQNVEDALANDVRSVLEIQEQNKDAEFEVKDVQYIHAEVKLVKCLVQNIVVDISFNQLGGLCTLCFLEQVDCLIGKDHLFKRSIILIKAWCYYESRILGAHHGLISTYALETLVLYIFHLFHSSLDGPLAVLYRFLDYFSKFDWDNYGISLNGPVALSSLPEIVAETPETDGGDLLLHEDFLRNCVNLFSVPPGFESNKRSFPQKHLNIVDPLKENNNLGRSVSKGNFYRIRSAFAYGARKLGRILSSSGESMEDELNKFFLNTLERHGSGQRPDVQDSFPSYRYGEQLGKHGSDSASSKSYIGKCVEDAKDSTPPSVDSTGMMSKTVNDGHGVLSEEFKSINILGSEKKSVTGIQKENKFSISHLNGNNPMKCSNSACALTVSEPDSSLEGLVVYGSRLDGDAMDLATSCSLGTRIVNNVCKTSPESNALAPISFGRLHCAPYVGFSHPSQEIERLWNGNLDQIKLANSAITEKKVFAEPQTPDAKSDHEKSSASNGAFQSCINHVDPVAVRSSDGLVVSDLGAYPSEIPAHVFESLNCFESNGRSFSNVAFRGWDMVGASGDNPEASKSLSDLSGDYNSHFNSLIYGRWCHGYDLCGPVLPFHLQSPSHYCNRSSRDAVHRSAHWKQNTFSPTNANGVIPNSLLPTAPSYYPVNHGAFPMEEKPKPRGTGTYFPNMNHRPYRERPHGRGRNSEPTAHNQMPRSRSGRVATQPDGMSLPDRGMHEPLPKLQTAPQVLAFGVNNHGKPSSTDFVPHVAKGLTPSNGGIPLTGNLEFGSFGPVQLVVDASSKKQRKLDSSDLEHTFISRSMLPTATLQKPRPNLNEERAPHSYHLKEEDFPPLSV